MDPVTPPAFKTALAEPFRDTPRHLAHEVEISGDVSPSREKLDGRPSDENGRRLIRRVESLKPSDQLSGSADARGQAQYLTERDRIAHNL